MGSPDKTWAFQPQLTSSFYAHVDSLLYWPWHLVDTFLHKYPQISYSVVHQDHDLTPLISWKKREHSGMTLQISYIYPRNKIISGQIFN